MKRDHALVAHTDSKRRKAAVWIWRILSPLLWLGIITIIFLHRKEFTVDAILAFTPSQPLLAALTMLALFALKSVSIVLYSGILFAVDGILFPLPWAIFLNLLGVAVMVTIPWVIGRKTGAASVEQIVKKYPKAEHLRNFRQRNDFLFVLLVRLLRILPCDIVSLYMGAIQVNYPQYLLGCLLGILPMAVTFPIMGMSITDIHSPVFLASVGAELVFMVLPVVFYQIHRKKRETKIQEKG